MLEEADAAARTLNEYRRQGDLERAQRTLSRDGEKILLRPRLNYLAKQMRALNQRRRAIQASRTIGAERKRAELDSIDERRNAIARQVAPYAETFD